MPEKALTPEQMKVLHSASPDELEFLLTFSRNSMGGCRTAAILARVGAAIGVLIGIVVGVLTILKLLVSVKVG